MNAILGETDFRPTQVKEIPGSSTLSKGILSIEYKHLNPSYELKRIFGPKILQNENRLVTDYCLKIEERQYSRLFKIISLIFY